jgi:hypothetical protein
VRRPPEGLIHNKATCRRCRARSTRLRRYALAKWSAQNPPTFRSDYVWFLVAAVILGLDYWVAHR